jgi:hypothetical protein
VTVASEAAIARITARIGPMQRRPAEREGEPHHIGAPQPDRLRDLGALLAVHQRDARQPEEMQTHDDDDDPATIASLSA